MYPLIIDFISGHNSCVALSLGVQNGTGSGTTCSKSLIQVNPSFVANLPAGPAAVTLELLVLSCLRMYLFSSKFTYNTYLRIYLLAVICIKIVNVKKKYFFFFYNNTIKYHRTLDGARNYAALNGLVTILYYIMSSNDAYCYIIWVHIIIYCY